MTAATLTGVDEFVREIAVSMKAATHPPVWMRLWAFVPRLQSLADYLDGLPQGAIDSSSEDVLSSFEANLGRVVASIDQLTDGLVGFSAVVRPLVRMKLRAPRDRIASALYAIERGYAPKGMPSRNEREQLASRVVGGGMSAPRDTASLHQFK